MHLGDFAPYSKGRALRLLEIYEAAYKYRKLPATDRCRRKIYEFQKNYDFNVSETLYFLDIVNNFSFAHIRTHLVQNDSSIVRIGKKTRPRKIKDE